MNILINKLFFISAIFALAVLGCKDPIEPIDSDFEARHCEGGKICDVGTKCYENTCECPDGTYYFHDTKYYQSDSACRKIMKDQFVLTYTEGPSESFKYWPIAELSPVQPDSFPDKMEFVFYPVTTPEQGGKSSDPNRSSQYYLRLNNIDEDSGYPLNLFLERTLMPMPLFRGVEGVNASKLLGEWNLEYSKDSIVIKLDLYQFEQPGSYLGSVKLVYEKVGL